jgi:hypothetical protein
LGTLRDGTANTETMEVVDELFELAKANRDLTSTWFAMDQAATMAIITGDIERAVDCVTQARQMAIDSLDLVFEMWANACEGPRPQIRGDLAGLKQHADELCNTLLPHRASAGVVWWGSIERVLGRLALLLTRTDDALTHLDAAVHAHSRVGAMASSARSHADLAGALVAVGRTDDARQERDAAERRLSDSLGRREPAVERVRTSAG